MSHVDEGAIHAYLDGQLDALPGAEAERIRDHLATCGACAARLEEERGLRQEVQGILTTVEPGIDAPPFEEIRRRAAARSSGRAGAWTRLRRLTWAASVVMAVGVGWMLRGEAPTASGDGSPTDPSDADVTAPVEAPVRERTEVRAPPEGEASAEAPRPTASPRRQSRASLAEDRTAGLVEPPEQSGEASVTEEPPTQPEVTLAVSGARSDSAAAGLWRRRMAEDLALRRPVLDSQTVAVRPVARVPADAWVDSLGRPRMRDEESPAAAGRGGLPGDWGVTETPSEPQAAFEVVIAAADDARPQAEESGSLVVPGLTVLSIEWLGGGTRQEGVRVLQRMEDGDTLEILHLPAEVDPGSIAQAPEDGRTRLVIPRDDGWLVVRARAERGELERLVRLMEGGG